MNIGLRGKPSIAYWLKSRVTLTPSVKGKAPVTSDPRTKTLKETYLIRMFAEFETGIRSFWITIKPRRTQTEVLLDRVGDKCKVPADVIDLAHSTRKYRNSLLHEREDMVDAVTISVAQRCFQHFLSRLPDVWGR